MTVQDIQSLIAEIDSILAGEKAGLPQPEVTSQSVRSEVLEKVRSYLVGVAEQRDAARPTGSRSPVVSADREEVAPDRLAAAIASAVVEQLDLQRAAWMQPWQMELEVARQQRSSLLREIQQLEGQRQQIIGDFLQVLLGRVSEGLKQEISQTLEKIETQLLYRQESGEMQRTGETTALPNSPTQRLEQLQHLQVQSDRLLLGLDRTFRQVFETLEKDLQGYEQSLSAAISRMYAIAYKGESILESKLDDSVPLAEPELQPLSPPPPTPSEQPLQPLELAEPHPQAPSPPLYPFPGIEIPLAESEPMSSEGEERDRDLASPVDIDAMDDSEIDALLQIEGDEDSEDRAAERLERSLEKQEEPSETPTVPATASESLAREVESQLFGDFRDPALPDSEEPSAQRTASAAQQPLSLEAELFGSAPPQTTALPSAGIDTVVDAAETQPMPETDETIPNLADTISSLTELLEQAYTSSEPEEVETFSAVPPGENLWAADEAEIQQEPLAEQALEDSQLSEQLAEDLQRFGGESEQEEAEPSEESETIGAATTESFEPPAELLGEDLEAVDLEDIWSEHQHDDLASESGEAENAALPSEIETDPWSEPANRASHPTEG